MLPHSPVMPDSDRASQIAGQAGNDEKAAGNDERKRNDDSALKTKKPLSYLRGIF